MELHSNKRHPIVKDIIEWLTEVEKTSSRIYAKAAKRFSHDSELSEFLSRMSKEECEHHEIMKRAGELIEEIKDLPTLIFLKSETKKDVESYLSLLESRIETKKISPEKLLEYIISIEFTAENNDLFKYVVNTLKHKSSEFTKLAAKIQRHRRNIERFVDRRPEFKRFAEEVRSVPRVWQEKLLVADGRGNLTDAVRSFLEEEGAVERARTGEEALRKIEDRYYAAVLADGDLPGLDEATFCTRVMGEFPTLRDRILFFVDKKDSKKQDLLEKNSINYLEKPSDLGDIKKKVLNILSR